MTDLRSLCKERGGILVSATSNTSRTMHIPQEDDLEPICRHRSKTGWNCKSLAQWPKGHGEWCSACVAVIEGP